MKKNISINIGGIIFHIEEDGYDRLQKYLDSITSYFSTFEDSKEIVEDIEGRIAEIFLATLEEGNQIITDVDITDLISKMGTTSDFEATIENEPEEQAARGSSQKGEPETETNHQQKQTETKTKKLRRDKKRKALGGVAAGVANYIQIDVIWVRLFFLFFLFNILLPGVSGITALVYIILWIVVPEDDSLEELTNIKKLFRSEDDKVLGGVAGGLASYFGVDVVLIRVLFVLSLFIGIGIIVYLIFWIITPEAKTITDRMQMEGEPVTISNIENSVKKRLNVPEEKTESPLVKVLLFPFRLISLVFNFLAKLIGPFFKVLVEIIRVAAGAFLTVLGIVFLLAFTVTLLVLIGVGGAFESWVQLGGFEAEQILDSAGILAIVSAYLVILIPALSTSFLGLAILLKRRVVKPALAWSMFAIWVLGMIGLSFSLPAIINNYRYENSFKEERTIELKDSIPTLIIDDFSDLQYESVTLRLRGHEDSTYLLKMEFESRGSSRRNARENAEDVDYSVEYLGDDILFGSGINIENAPFRFQQMEATFYVPYGKIFRMEYELGEILRNSLWLYDYDQWDMEDNDWVFDEDGLKCLTCEDLDS